MTAEELFEQLQNVKIGRSSCRFPIERCRELVPLINEINEIKKEKNAVVLAHSYVSPEIIYGVADFTGDSYKLAKDASQTKADTIVFSAVRFMAETAKILNPDKTVYVPSTFNGCSLADSITGDQVRELKKAYPEYTFVCYINTTADVKAECHTCVTSSNVYDICEKIDNDKIFFLPDRLMAENLKIELKARGVAKDIKYSLGTCYVHEQYSPEMIDLLREEYQGLKVLSHPECSPAVASKADFVGSTSQMLNFVKKDASDTFFLLTECGLTGRLEVEVPEKKFVGTCTQCRYMKSNTLHDIKRVLTQPKAYDEIHLSHEIAQGAVRSIEKMFEYTEGKRISSSTSN